MRRLVHTKFEEDVFRSDDFISDDMQEDLLDNDEISGWEAAFSRGYAHAYDDIF